MSNLQPPTFPLCFIIIHRHRESPTKRLPDQSSQNSCQMGGLWKVPDATARISRGCRLPVGSCMALLPPSAHSLLPLIAQSCPASSLGNSPSLLFPIPLIPTLNRSKGKKGPCYFKWSLTQLYKEHKIKPFSQAITPGQLKQAENSIPAHNCRIWRSLSLHILRLLEKGGREGQGTTSVDS